MYQTPLAAAAFPVATSNKSEAARTRLRSYVSRGAQQQRQLVTMVQEMVIQDALVAPSLMNFAWGSGSANGRLKVMFEGAPRDFYYVNTHAQGQLAGILEYPRAYMSKLEAGVVGIAVNDCRQKLTNDLDWHAHNCVLKDRRGNPARYLVRSVGDEIRGVLSRNYKRHLASKPLLTSFLQACEQYGLQPFGAAASPVRVSIQCALPYVFEPYDGEFVAVGVCWSNSDFGGGRMKVSLCLYRMNGGTSIILNDAVSQVHIGAIIEESDIELSPQTIHAELTAQRSAINDAVVQQCSPEHVQKILDVVRAAHEEQVPWSRLKADLSRILHKHEIEQLQALLSKGHLEYEELPSLEYDIANDPLPTRWWASAALGYLAEQEANADRKKDMQEFAGQLIGKVKSS